MKYDAMKEEKEGERERKSEIYIVPNKKIGIKFLYIKIFLLKFLKKKCVINF